MQDTLSQIPRPNSKFPRKFFVNLNPSKWEELEPLFEELLETELLSLQDLKNWIDALSEIQAILSEEGARCYINMTCYTQDEDNTKAYTHFIEDIEPRLAPFQDKLNKKLIEHPLISQLDSHYKCWLQEINNEISLFQDSNIPLETKVALESQKYQALTSSMSVYFQGESKTMPQMGAYLEESDRGLREAAWKASAEERLSHKDKLNEHFNTLFEVRQNISKNCGFDNFIPYIFKAKSRFDYTPQDCSDFADSVEKLIVPLYRKRLQDRKQELGLDSLRPWDLSCDPQGREALKPFASTKELVQGADQLFEKIDPTLHSFFQEMQDKQLLDLDSRMGKAPGGYQCGLEESRIPFIFMNSVGTNSDLFTLLHEGGHSFHQFLMQEQNLTAYRDIASEIAEVASMSMELIGSEFLHHIYSEEDTKRTRLDQFDDVLRLLPWVATIDSFQHWMYANPNHTEQERKDKWLELDKRFGPEIDWSGIEEYREYSWQKQLHLFEVPFYYIEYGIAQLGALQIWRNFREDPKKALQDYKSGFALGSSLPLPELFEKTGIPFDFSEKSIKPLVDLILQEMEQLSCP